MLINRAKAGRNLFFAAKIIAGMDGQNEEIDSGVAVPAVGEEDCQHSKHGKEEKAAAMPTLSGPVQSLVEEVKVPEKIIKYKPGLLGGEVLSAMGITVNEIDKELLKRPRALKRKRTESKVPEKKQGSKDPKKKSSPKKEKAERSKPSRGAGGAYTQQTKDAIKVIKCIPPPFGPVYPVKKKEVKMNVRSNLIFSLCNQCIVRTQAKTCFTSIEGTNYVTLVMCPLCVQINCQNETFRYV